MVNRTDKTKIPHGKSQLSKNTPVDRSAQKIYLITVVSMFLIACLIASIYPRFIVDDFWILCRYADNFRTSGHLVYNMGEYLEGCTGILLLFLLIISPLKYILTVHLLTVISFIIGGITLKLLVEQRPQKFLILGMYLFAPIIYTHIFSGLETILFTTLTLLGFYFYIKKNNHGLLITAVLISLCRPEGILFAVVLLFDNKKLRIKYLAILLVYLAVKYYYYGDLFPGSYYRKDMNIEKNLLSNWIQFRGFLLFYFPFVLIFYSKLKQHLRFVIFCLVLWGYYLVSNLETNFSYRFFFHCYPLLLAVVGVTAQKINKKLLIGLFVIQGVLFTFSFIREFSYVKEHVKMNSYVEKTGILLRDNYSPSLKLAVYYDAGLIPYLSKMNTLDLSGLLSKDIAQFEHYNKGNVSEIFTYKINRLLMYEPSIFVITSYYRDSVLKRDAFTNVLKQYYSWNDYKLVGIIGDTTKEGYTTDDGISQINFGGYYEYVFVRHH